MLPDDSLVEMYISGVNEAFDTLLNRYKDRLYSYIFYSIRNADMADDLFQETFVKAIITLQGGNYTHTGKFYPWLMRIAHNLNIDQFRVAQNENAATNDDISMDQYRTNAFYDNCNEREREAELSKQQVCDLIHLLPEEQKEIVRMRIYDNVSFKDIATIKGISINTALGRMHYAVLNMRRMAKEQAITPTLL